MKAYVAKALIFVMIFCLSVVFLYMISKPTETTESYTNTDRAWEVYESYEEVLNRLPNDKEFRNAMTRKESKSELMFRLRSSDEFTSLQRMQKQTTDPNALIALRDAQIVSRTVEIYKEIKRKEPHRTIHYPLRDLWMILKAEEGHFRGLLRVKWWDMFEKDIIREVPNGLNRPKLKAMLDELRDMHGKETWDFDWINRKKTPSKPSDNSWKDKKPTGICPSLNIDKDLMALKKSDLLNMFEEIAKRTNTQSTDCDMRFPKHWHQRVNVDPNRDLVLRPEFQWSVPQMHPPACADPSERIGN